MNVYMGTLVPEFQTNYLVLMRFLTYDLFSNSNRIFCRAWPVVTVYEVYFYRQRLCLETMQIRVPCWVKTYMYTPSRDF